MAAISASFLLGVLGNILSILVFSSPMRTFWRIWKRKSTQNFKGLPYVCTLLSTSLWTYYGLIKPGGTLILTINAAGSVLQSFYVIVFLIFAPRQRKIRTGLLSVLLNGICFGSVFVGTFIGLKGSRRIFAVGAVCSAVSVSMYASPLSVMRTVVRSKSVEFMPFFLSLFLFLNGGVWALYALLVKDVFVEIPNAIGFVLGAVQLLVYAYYRKYGKSIKRKNLIKDSTSINDDVEMGRSVSLPKQLDTHDNSSQLPTSVPKHQSLPAKIIKTSSDKIKDLLNFLQENDVTDPRSKQENGFSQDQALLMKDTQRSPRVFP